MFGPPLCRERIEDAAEEALDDDDRTTGVVVVDDDVRDANLVLRPFAADEDEDDAAELDLAGITLPLPPPPLPVPLIKGRCVLSVVVVTDLGLLLCVGLLGTLSSLFSAFLLRDPGLLTRAVNGRRPVDDDVCICLR